MSCVVVGSGIAGLSATLLLARQGLPVTLLEAQAGAAPLLRGFRRNGLYFDTGFHYGGGLERDGLLRRWLQALGIWDSLTNVTTEHSDIFHFADGPSYVLPSLPSSRLLEAMETQFPGSGAGMRALLDDMRAVLARSPYTNPLLRQESFYREEPMPGVADYLAGKALHPHLRAMLSIRCLLYGAYPKESGLREYAMAAGPYFESAGTWDGGGEALVAAFLKKLAQYGVQARCNAAVVGLEGAAKSGMRAVILQGGERIPCDCCVYTGNPRRLEQLLAPGALRPVFFRHIAGLPETAPPFILFAEEYDAPDAARNIYLLPSSEDENSIRPLGMPDPTIYLYRSGIQKGERRGALTAIAITSAGEIPGDPGAYAEWKRATRAALCGQIERRYPVLRGKWKVLDAASGATFRRWVYGCTGSMYGIRHDRTDVPLLPVTRIPGLFLAGQNIVLPGVLGGIISGALAVGFAIGHEQVLREFRICAGAE
ncbi:MAG: FAD-dependent oxidoreductase [Desulfovibrio sp.]|jgi:all-trans-retinol 13,14-reductase|nr:FAD-dependent oxidoreductase [Desulfovibrio sp.]